jgi:hypothetical protein
MLDLLGPQVSARKLRLFGAACCRRAADLSPGPFARQGLDLADRFADGQEAGEDLTRFRSELLYEGFSGDDGHWRKRAFMARWHFALAVFNALQDAGRFRGGERRPVFEESIQGHHDDVLHFALSQARKEASPGCDPTFDRPDICRPDLTRVWEEAAWAVAYRLRPDDRPDLTVVQMLTQPDDRRRRDDWEAALVADFRHEAEQQASLGREVFGSPFRPVTVNPSWLTSTVTALARRMYESRDFGAMPVLADALQDAECDNGDLLDHCRGPGPHVRGCWAIDAILGERWGGGYNPRPGLDFKMRSPWTEP